MELDNLSKMGSSYQNKVLYTLLNDNNFFKQVIDIVKIEYFESEARQWIIEKIIDYYTKYKSLITLAVLKTELVAEDNEILALDIKNKLRDIYTQNITDIQYIKDNFLQFCINQRYKIALYNSIDLMKEGNFEAMGEEFKEAAKAGLPQNKGIDVTSESVDHVLRNSRTGLMNTPWEVLDDYTQGGFGNKELIIFAGSPGSGKTWTLVQTGLHALYQGKNVLHITLELSEENATKRYYSCDTHITSANLKENVSKIKGSINKWTGRLFVKEYPTKQATVNTLSAYIDRMINEIGKIDVVIVDYADLLKPATRRNERRIEIGEIYEDLRGIASLYDVKMITASQLNRSSLQADYGTGEHLADDFSKLMIGDFVLSLTRKIEDVASNSVRFFIIKNRFGPDQILIPGELNVATGETKMFSPNTIEGKNKATEMQSSSAQDDKIKMLIKQRLGK